MDPDKEKPESRPVTQSSYDGQMPEFNLENALAVLKSLCLNFGTLGDYLVVMNGKADAIINGEPYLALQLWFNMVSGKFIGRIWGRSVSYDKVDSIDKFAEVCNKYFQYRPCVGYTLGDEEQYSQAFVISQTPLPRKISRECKGLLNKNINDDIQSCQECLKAGYSGLELKTEVLVEDKFDAEEEDLSHHSSPIDQKPKPCSMKQDNMEKFSCDSCDFKTHFRKNLSAHVKVQHDSIIADDNKLVETRQNNPDKTKGRWWRGRWCLVNK